MCINLPWPETYIGKVGFLLTGGGITASKHTEKRNRQVAFFGHGKKSAVKQPKINCGT